MPENRSSPLKENVAATARYKLRELAGLSVLQFSAVLLLYFVGGTVWAVNQGVSLWQAVPLVLGTGVILSAALIAVCRMVLHEMEEKAHERLMRFSPAEGKYEKQDSDGDSTEQEKLRRGRRIKALKKEAAKMHDKIFKTGAIVAVSMVFFWLVMSLAYGYSPKEVFFIPWYFIFLAWFFYIVLFPNWLTYLGIFSMIAFRFAAQMFGAQLIFFLPQLLFLPVFYLVMMFFMYGSIMLPNLMQLKFFKPGDATWETPDGSMRGQPEARAIVETEMRKFEAWAEGRSNRRATRGMIFDGPPGTGKTLYAKELATKYDLPFVLADAQALNPPFAGFGPLMTSLYFRPRVEALAKEYGGAFVFIDEAEQLLGMRSGMSMGGQGGMGPEVRGVRDIWDMLPSDTKDRFSRQFVHYMMFGGMGGGGGGSAIFSFLTWLDGADSPPLMEKLFKGKLNDLLNAFFLPVTLRGRLMRFPPGKPRDYNLIFIAASNRAWMIDPAMRRPGRFGIKVPFKTPSVEARKDIADRYFTEAVKKGWLHPDLYNEDKMWEFARSTPGMSPAEIEMVIKQAADVRIHHVETLKRIKEYLDSGTTEDNFLEQDKKYWLLYKDTLGESDWDDRRADWASLMESRSQVLWGRAEPGITSLAHKERTAYHEFMGHFIELSAFLKEHMRPTVLSVMPRGSALGMVAHVPVEERDPMPQAFYEGLIRVSVGSTIAERFFFNENQPGVGQDLENATSIACFMVGKCAMTPYQCSAEDMERYRAYGETLISIPEMSASLLNPFAQALTDKILTNPKTRERIAVILGQAAVDVYRLIRANMHLADDVIPELMKLDEISGKKLEDLWEKLDREIISLKDPRMPEDCRNAWPDRHFAPANPFYFSKKPEAEELPS